MKRFSRWLAELTIKNARDTRDTRVRAAYGTLEGGISIVLNVLLFAVKLALGLSVKSVALVADAVHTLTDTLTSVVIIVGLKMAGKPPDPEHPFGHGKMEPVATLVVAVLLGVAGFELLKEAALSVFSPHKGTVSFSVILIVIGTLLAKELMARFSYALGDIIDSGALRADGAHHRSDALSTVLVVVALIGSHFKLYWLDGVMGAGVALMIFYFAYRISKEAISPLLGEAPPPETIGEIQRIAAATPKVLRVHDIIYHNYGGTVDISLHIEVSDKESAMALHDVAEAVEEEVGRRLGGRVIVHVDPIRADHPRYQEVALAIEELIAADPRLQSFHELRLVDGEEGRCKALFDVELADDASELDAPQAVEELDAAFRRRFPEITPAIRTEPRYVYNP